MKIVVPNTLFSILRAQRTLILGKNQTHSHFSYIKQFNRSIKTIALIKVWLLFLLNVTIIIKLNLLLVLRN